eukprot:53894-Chlamydomonas_euryale.AAC.4
MVCSPACAAHRLPGPTAGARRCRNANAAPRRPRRLTVSTWQQGPPLPSRAALCSRRARRSARYRRSHRLRYHPRGPAPPTRTTATPRSTSTGYTASATAWLRARAAAGAAAAAAADSATAPRLRARAGHCSAGARRPVCRGRGGARPVVAAKAAEAARGKGAAAPWREMRDARGAARAAEQDPVGHVSRGRSQLWGLLSLRNKKRWRGVLGRAWDTREQRAAAPSACAAVQDSTTNGRRERRRREGATLRERALRCRGACWCGCCCAGGAGGGAPGEVRFWAFEISGTSHCRLCRHSWLVWRPHNATFTRTGRPTSHAERSRTRRRTRPTPASATRVQAPLCCAPYAGSRGAVARGPMGMAGFGFRLRLRRHQGRDEAGVQQARHLQVGSSPSAQDACGKPGADPWARRVHALGGTRRVACQGLARQAAQRAKTLAGWWHQRRMLMFSAAQ